MSRTDDRSDFNFKKKDDDGINNVNMTSGEGKSDKNDKIEEDFQWIVQIRNLYFKYSGYETEMPYVLQNVSLNLKSGERCLLVGSNGSGKSTLLRILAGRHLPYPPESVTLLGSQSFYDTKLNMVRTHLDSEWGSRTRYGCFLQADIPVNTMMRQLQDEYPDRRKELMDLLGVDPHWRLHEVSNGQRRRIQIFLGLIRPFKVLLMDNVAVSLDVVARQDLFQWLKKESEQTGAVIIYTSHIFDGMDDWPTHIHCLSKTGKTLWSGKFQDMPNYRELRKIGDPSPILHIVEEWCRRDLE